MSVSGVYGGEVEPLCLQRPARSGRAGPVLRQRRMHVHRVRHDRRADHGAGQQHTVGAGEPGQQSGSYCAPVGACPHREVAEAGRDDREQPGHCQLEPARVARAHSEQQVGERRGDQRAGQHRHADQQLQSQRAADDLGQVGGHGHQLGLRPQHQIHRAPVAVATDLGEVAPGGQAELGGEALHEHRCGVGQHHHPHQPVAEARPGRQVRRDVARVDVGDAGHERRPEQQRSGAYPPQPRARRAPPDRTGRRSGDVRDDVRQQNRWHGSVPAVSGPCVRSCSNRSSASTHCITRRTTSLGAPAVATEAGSSVP